MNRSLVLQEGIVKQQYHKPSNDASQTYGRKRRVTIVFRDNPFFGQDGLILEETLGRHSDLHLELSNGKRIRIDAAWTDYFGVEPSQNPKTVTHCVDFAQVQPVIRFIEYLREKQETGDPSPVAATSGSES